jgi:hypothetical protein
MPSWGNSDSLADKPHFPQERQVRPTVTLTTANNTVGNAGKTIIFTGIGALTAANLGVVAGMSAFAANVSTSGEQEFFVSNNKVASVSTNTVTFQNTFFGTIPAGSTIDFANNTVIRAQTATGLVATLSNFVTGKVVDAWITNTAGTNQTFTHGVSAINSTVNATTYNIPSTSTIYVKYWSMDGTLANTFVAITK